MEHIKKGKFSGKNKIWGRPNTFMLSPIVSIVYLDIPYKIDQGIHVSKVNIFMVTVFMHVFFNISSLLQSPHSFDVPHHIISSAAGADIEGAAPAHAPCYFCRDRGVPPPLYLQRPGTWLFVIARALPPFFLNCLGALPVKIPWTTPELPLLNILKVP